MITVLGLPDNVIACLFDLDGVLTDTASVHEAAWKRTFDEIVHPPFSHEDYEQYVDGKPREAGVRDFLASRGQHPSDDEVDKIASRKNDLLLKKIDDEGVTVFEGSRRFLQSCQERGIHRAVVSSSANTAAVLKVTGLDILIEARVDGVTAKDDGLKGKPAPDTFLAGAKALGLEPSQCCVFEDALAGVEAGRAGHFGYVIGVDRVGHAAALRDHGADRVVADLAELL